MLGLLVVVVTSCLLMTGCHGNQESGSSARQGIGEVGHTEVDERVRRSTPVKNSVLEHLLGEDLTTEQQHIEQSPSSTMSIFARRCFNLNPLFFIVPFVTAVILLTVWRESFRNNWRLDK